MGDPVLRRQAARLVLPVTVLGIALAMALGAAAEAGAEEAGPPVLEPRIGFVPSAADALVQLSRRPDALGFSREGLRAGTLCKHYQGLARGNAADGTPYLFLTKSGNKSICLLQDDEPGYFFSAAMASRNRAGERLGTNLLPFGTSFLTGYSVPATFADDRIVRELVFDGTDLPAYRHPGGMQAVGDILAIGVETPFGGETKRATIVFLNVEDPAHPTYLGRFDPPALDEPDGSFGTDPVGMTLVKGPEGTCCRLLLVAAGGDANEQVRFFLSRDRSNGTAAGFDPAGWDEVGRYSEAHIEGCLGADWPTSGVVQGGQHQMLNFVRQGNLDGPLYLVGGRRDGTVMTPGADEILELYRVNLDADGTPSDCPLTYVSRKKMAQESWATEEEVSGFSAAAGVYVSPSGEFMVYSTRHEARIRIGPDPQNPSGDLTTWVLLEDHVPVGEYRDTALVRDDSPTLRPRAVVDGPVTVPEGQGVVLTGRGEHAVQKAYVQLFEDDGVGSSLPEFPDDDRWVTIEFDQRDADAFDSLDELGGGVSGIWENAGSVRWFAPVGCTISLNDYPRRSTQWPGPDTVLLRGTGRIEQATDLDALPAYSPDDAWYPVAPVPPGTTATPIDRDDDVEGVTFYHRAKVPGGGEIQSNDCQAYYAAPVGIEWDMTSDGSFGSSALFSALALDGPTTATVGARAKHAYDVSPLGTGATLHVPVRVTNVAPVVAAPSLVDSLGNSLTTSGAVAVLGLPVTLSATFTDPGRPDTQTASVGWGDGTAPTAPDLLTQATGGVTGTVRHAHAFTRAGTFPVTVTVTDDDGGQMAVTQDVTVASLEQAIEAVVGRIDAILASSPAPGVVAALTAARDDLVGNRGGTPPTNGALDKLDANDPSGAITKLRAAIGLLVTAESRGAGDLKALKDLLGLVAEGIANDAYVRAKAWVGAGPPGQQRALTTVEGLIQTGHERLAAGRHVDACDPFRQAVDKALALLR